jgi:hypothetical protein
METVSRYVTHLDRVQQVTPFNTENVSVIENNPDPNYVPGVTGAVMGVPESANGSNESHPYIYEKQYKYEKEVKDRFNPEVKNSLSVKSQRWAIISTDLDPYVKRKWTHSEESERLLDVIEERKGLKFLTAELGHLDFATSHNNCGLLLSHLRKLAGEKSPVKKPVPVSDPPAKPLEGIDVSAFGRSPDN